MMKNNQVLEKSTYENTERNAQSTMHRAQCTEQKEGCSCNFTSQETNEF